MAPISQALAVVAITAAITGANVLAYIACGIGLALELAVVFAASREIE